MIDREREFWITNSKGEFKRAVDKLEEVNRRFLPWIESNQYKVMEKIIRSVIQDLTSTLFFLKELERGDKDK